MGGSNNFIWAMDNDKVLQRYGKEPQLDDIAGQEPELPTPSLTRSQSIVSDEEIDEYFDAQETFQRKDEEPVVPKTFKFSTQKTTVTITRHATRPHSSSLILFVKRSLYNLFQLTFGPKKGLMYWVLLYLILRGPVEKLIQKILIQSTLIKSKKRLGSTTLGITAIVAAITATGMTNALEKYRSKRDK